MIFEFEKVKDDVLSNIDSLKLEFNSKSGVSEYIINFINTINDNGIKIVKKDGTDVTKKFIKSLNDLLSDEMGREFIYEFKPLDREVLFKSDGIFLKIPTIISVNSDIFSIFYIPDGREIARCVLTKVSDFEYSIDFMELISDYKHLSFFDIIKDCINKEYGNVDFKFDKDMLGRNKTGINDNIPNIPVENLNIIKDNVNGIPEISLKICDVKPLRTF